MRLCESWSGFLHRIPIFIPHLFFLHRCSPVSLCIITCVMERSSRNLKTDPWLHSNLDCSFGLVTTLAFVLQLWETQTGGVDSQLKAKHSKCFCVKCYVWRTARLGSPRMLRRIRFAPFFLPDLARWDDRCFSLRCCTQIKDPKYKITADIQKKRMYFMFPN